MIGKIKNIKKIEIQRNKTLRLDNVLIGEILNISADDNADDELLGDMSIEAKVEKMQNEIRVGGAAQIGPLIQYSGTSDGEDGLEMKISLMLQADKYLHDVRAPYRMEPLIKANNCMYTRFTGMEEDMHFAYQKIAVTAYEEDIKLKGSSYTVFLDLNDDGTITTDIFMEKADE